MVWLALPAFAQDAASSIAVDGTLPGVAFDALDGPSYQLTAEDHGHQVGGNLLFSFLRFGLLEGEEAAFSGPASVANVVARVTGSEASLIDGTLRNTIDDAALFFINPNGVIFGEHARLDVRGAVHVSTADYLGFEDASEFHARSPERDTPFSTAPIASFGFLSEDPAGISVLGSTLSTALLEPVDDLTRVARGRPLALVGGDIRIEGPGDQGEGAALAVLYTGGGRLDLASVDSAGTVSIAAADEGAGTEADLVVEAVALGDIELTGGVAVVTGGPPPDDILVHTDGSGDVFIRARNLTLRNTEVRAITTSHRAAGRIDVDLQGDFLADGAGRSEVTGLVAGSGLQVGDTHVQGIELSSSYPPGAQDPARIVIVFDGAGRPVRVEHQGRGDGGVIEVSAANVSLEGGAKLSSSGVFGGDGGDVRVASRETLRLAGTDVDGDEGGIFANAQRSGDAGTISIAAPDLLIEQAAGVFTEVRGGDGTGGSIQVGVDRLRIASRGQIDTSNRGAGSGGRIEVRAREWIELEGMGSEIATVAHEEASGDAGQLLISAPEIRLSGGAAITTESLAVPSPGVPEVGDAGTVDVRGDRVELTDSSISSASAGGAGGDIYINGGPLVQQPDGSHRIDKPEDVVPGERVTLERSEITTSVAGGDGGGGNIAIDPDFVILRDSRVVAQAVDGPGGNIRIVAGSFIADFQSLVDASSQFSADGSVEISSPSTDLRGDLSRLPSEIIDVVSLLRERCAARRSGAAAASFVLAGRDGVPANPEDFLPAFHRRVAPTGAGAPVAHQLLDPSVAGAAAEGALALTLNAEGVLVGCGAWAG